MLKSIELDKTILKRSSGDTYTYKIVLLLVLFVNVKKIRLPSSQNIEFFFLNSVIIHNNGV